MASQTRSTRLPNDLAEVAELRAAQLGYPNWNAYVKGLIRYDAMVQGKHDMTLPIASLSLKEQDRIDAELLENTKKGIGVRGQFLTHFIKQVLGVNLPHA